MKRALVYVSLVIVAIAIFALFRIPVAAYGGSRSALQSFGGTRYPPGIYHGMTLGFSEESYTYSESVAHHFIGVGYWCSTNVDINITSNYFWVVVLYPPGGSWSLDQRPQFEKQARQLLANHVNAYEYVPTDQWGGWAYERINSTTPAFQALALTPESPGSCEGGLIGGGPSNW